MGGIQKASGMETSDYEKDYSEWSEETSFPERMLSFEKDGQLYFQEQI